MKNYEIPISPNYVNNWGTKEALRELLQNAIDAEKCGYEKNITYDEQNCLLSISNKGTYLPVSSLVLGCSSKEDSDDLIGKYGEGYKLALVVLLRKGFVVNIKNGKEIWTPSFKISETFNTQILNIEVVDCFEERENLTFNISSVSKQLYDEILENFPCINGFYGEVIPTKCGEILLDKNFKGKMFVSGLYIQTDNNFSYGYNFKPSVVQLDRDRKAINYYELRGLTAESIVSADNCHPVIFKAIGDSVVDARDIKDVIDQASDEFLESYRDMLYENKNLEENTLIATESVLNQLNQMNLSVPVAKGTEIESYLIAKANDKIGLIEEAQSMANNSSKIDDAFSWFRSSQYRRIMCWLNKRTNVSKKNKEELKVILQNFPLVDSNYNLIRKYIPEDFDYELSSVEELEKIYN